jgi:enamine deaminase RidA (YjgF/YER057c/UK114 family)
MPERGGTAERYGLIRGPDRPSICLAMAKDDWVTVCCTAPDRSQDISGQTRQIFDIFERHLAEAGSCIQHVLFAQVWLKRMSDYAALNAVWNDWIDSDHPPARSCVRADMARADSLIEIRITAAR